MNHLFILFLLIIFTIALSPVTAKANNEALGAEEPIEFYTDLDGEWFTFEKELLSPQEVKAKLNEDSERVSLPASFQSAFGDVNSYATYSRTVDIPDEYIGETIAVYIPFQYSAYRLFADDEEVAGNGEVGVNPAAHHAEMAPRIAYFIAEDRELLLTMQISSFDHIRGGFENSIYLGEASIVTGKFHSSLMLAIFINGCIFIIGLFMVLFALYRRSELLFFVFGLFAMLISVRSLFAVPFYYTLLPFDISWLWGTRLEYILTEATSMFYVVLLWKWHEEYFSKRVMYGLVAIHTALILITLFTEPVFFQALFFNVFTITIPVFIYVVYVMMKSIRNNNSYAKMNLIGVGLIFLAFFNDYAIGQGWYQSVPLMMPAVALYVFMHVVTMSKRFADTMKNKEKQNRQLLELNASNEKLALGLQQEIKQKDDFLANTSHELRNPLHGIINLAQSLLNDKEELDEKAQHDLKLILTVGNHMSQTIEDLLDITRLKEQRIQLKKQPVDLESTASGVADMLKMVIENKNLKMDVRIPKDLPLLYADKNRLIQILFNLLHNAVKYTEEGRIMIQAEEKDGMAEISIADTGIGMSEEMLDTIFHPYEQGDSSITAIVGGLGLGLHTTRELVEIHGGTIEARSVLNEGSVFTFTLPLAGDKASEEELTEESEPPVEISEYVMKDIPFMMSNKMLEVLTKDKPSQIKSRILAVDDDPVNLQVLQNILPARFYQVKTVRSGKEALQAIDQGDWDLIISDVMMPGMSGYQLTRKIREKFSISELPVILLTARSSPDDVYTGFLAGANDYVTKPVDAIELNVRVRALTDLKASIKERLAMEAAWLQAQIRPHFLLNTLNAIVSLSEIDHKRMTRLVSEFASYLQRSFYLKNLEEVVPLADELDLVDSYLYIEKVRFGSRLNVEREIDDTEGISVPPLALQTLAENAVNHGILKKREGGTIKIRVTKENQHAVISVIDDGVGMSEEKICEIFTVRPDRKRGIGLINTNERLKRLYGKGIHVESEEGAGTVVSFEVPVENL